MKNGKEYNTKGDTLMYYKIYGGIPSGLDSDVPYHGTIKFANENDAFHYAWICAVEEYESYGGMHGYYDRDFIYDNPEEFGLDSDSDTFDEDVEFAYQNEIESWVDYWAVLATGPDDIDNEYS